MLAIRKVDMAKMINKINKTYAYETEYNNQQISKLLPGTLEQLSVSALLIDKNPYQRYEKQEITTLGYGNTNRVGIDSKNASHLILIVGCLI